MVEEFIRKYGKKKGAAPTAKQKLTLKSTAKKETKPAKRKTGTRRKKVVETN
jgi:hypothetical protein